MSEAVVATALRAQGRIGEGDYVAAQFLHLRPGPLPLAALGLLVAGCVVGLALTRSPVLLSTCAALASYVVLVMPWRARRRYRANPAIARPVRIAIDAEGLRFDRGGREQALRWDQIGRWRGSRQLVLLYPVESGFYLVPAAFFARAEDFDAFTALLRDRVGSQQ
ncbi:YcxB family protein [Solimonas sp. K1W22B-7]|uniref:YcxB family protein n=1 Tax=Solimonas sp. K1W22B-7 TaxID=2303331 RepID=UPI000E3367B4|nr:YcxB family protein [Solimonas sp. K1W22B-7]AXQ27648.1 YcxB family protein [Solimonas sp. K1W22B-7]